MHDEAEGGPPDAPRNVQSGRPVAETTFDGADRVASAATREGVHYEPDAQQGVKVAHQTHPQALPVDSPTDYDRLPGAEDTRLQEVRVTPSDGSVREALPPQDEPDPES